MYWIVPVALSFCVISAPALSALVVRLSVLFGTRPFTSCRVSERRKFARSFAPCAAPLVVIVWPVLKKTDTLFGCATHGPPSASPAVVRLYCERSVPSSGGPQLSSTPSFTPP